MKIACIMWNSYVPTLRKAVQDLGFDVRVYSARKLDEDPGLLREAEADMECCDLVLLYRTRDLFWDGLEGKVREIGAKKPIVCMGHDPSYWLLSTVRPDIIATAQSYLTINGLENMKSMLRFIASEVLGEAYAYSPPEPTPWEGIFHPDAPSYYTSVKDYLAWYGLVDRPMIGLLCSRMSWVNGDQEIENTLIGELEALGMGVIPVFSYSVRDGELGTRSLGEVVQDYFVDGGAARLDALVKLNPFFLESGRLDADASGATAGVGIFNALGVPVFEPIIASYQRLDEWEAGCGLSADVGWSVAMPEFEGVIEPIIVGASADGQDALGRRAIRERCARLARRVKSWASLRGRPAADRRVAFILHNNPCSSAEASVGGAAGLDSIESVSRVLQAMKAAGYTVDPPESGRALIGRIMEKKALSEFRWTPVSEIVRRGGALGLVTKEEYGAWFETLDEAVRSRMAEAWGRPPGEAKGGTPAAMVYEGNIVITGLKYGNAVVCVQPKRGCAGSRCDGQVCKILHDPDVPPTHQYLATYRWLEKVFRADVLVHVGTHGNLEFLPGKGVGLSSKCYPDIAIGDMPHLYIYNSDNPPEGAIAKRRSYACLVDHMQAVFTAGGLYGELEEVDRMLGEYENVKHDRARAHALQHLLIEAVMKAKLEGEIGYEDDMPLGEMARRAHEALARVRNTQIQSGMHVFGDLPENERLASFIASILRYGDEEQALRRRVAATMGFELDDLVASPGSYSESLHMSYGALLEKVDEASARFVGQVLAGGEVPEGFEAIGERARDVAGRVGESREIGALLSGMDGRYIPAGPSGLILRGRDDVLPTGRNFYSLDPRRVPTKPAWRVGRSLARSLLEKHLKDSGRLPENIAYYWMCNDIMWADGEGMAMLFFLLGVEPEWLSNGRLKGFKVIPLKKLGRPRIDITVRVSGITRDNFSNCIDVLDEAVQAVASLDEPLEMNFPRKHALASLEGMPAEGQAWRDATYRIFGSMPGTYQSGVSLAVYASAWKDEKDLSDVYVYWNGYAYGKAVNGTASHQRFVDRLKTVDATFNKVASDEQDLFVCCCYFSGHGGMTIAARSLSGNDVKAYYGDTRESGHVEVRSLADEVRRVVRTRLLNPRWIEGMKAHGYKGAGDIMKRVGRVYGWEATTREVDDWVFDDIAKAFVLDAEMRKFFEENNPYALEEISRRLLEAEQRGLWDADREVLKGLKEAYLEIEGLMEGRAGEGEYQGSSVDVRAAGDVGEWAEKMGGVLGRLHR